MKRVLLITLSLFFLTGIFASEPSSPKKMTLAEFRLLNNYKIIASGENWVLIEIDGSRYLVVI